MRLALCLGALALSSLALAGTGAAGGTPYANCVTPSYPLLLGYGYTVLCVLDDGVVNPGDPAGPGVEQRYNNLLYLHSVQSGVTGFGDDKVRVGQDTMRWGEGATSGEGRGTTVEGSAVMYSLLTGQGSTTVLQQEHDQEQTCDTSNVCRSTDSTSTTFDSVTFLSVRDGPSRGVGVHYASSQSSSQGCQEQLWVDTEEDGQVTRNDIIPSEPCVLANGVPQVADRVPFPDWPDLPRL